MTITSGDLIYATDFTNLVTKINSKITEANRNDANISRLEMDYSHPIGRNQEIHHENVNRIIDKYNELITNSENMSGGQLLNLIQQGQIIQNSINAFKTIVNNIDNILFEAAIGSLQIKGPFEVNENRSEKYGLDKAVEGGTGWEQVTTGVNWSLSGTGAAYASISTSGYLKTESVPSDQQITLHASYTDDYGTHSTSKEIVIKRIAEIIGLEIQSIDGSGQNIVEGDKHRYKCTAILDNIGSTQLLAGGFNWISTNSTKLLIDEVFNDPDYPGIKIAEITTTNIDQETESLTLRASYKGKTGQKSLIVSNAASIVTIYIEDKDENAEIRTVEGERQTLRAYGFTSDSDRDAILLDQEDLTWEIWANNNTGSYFDGNQFVPGTMISGDTPVIIKCTYKKGTIEQKYVTREVIIEKNADVVAIAIYRQGASDDPLSSLNVLEDAETQLGCTVYFSDNTSDTDPDPRFVSWTFDNLSDAILSGTAIDSETGLLETGEISQDLSLQLRVSYRGFDGTRELIVRNIIGVEIGDIDGNTTSEVTIDEGTAFSFRLYARHNAGKTLVSGDLTWEFWKDNSSYNPPFANVNRRTGEVSANNSVNKDEITQLKCTWITARTERMYTAYKAVKFHDTNYPISLEIEVPGILYEGQSIFLTAKATLDNGEEITVDKDDTAMNWSITNYNGISSNLLTINSEGMLTLEDVDFNTNTVLVRGTYAKNGQSKSKSITVDLQGIFVEALEIFGVNMNRLGTGQSTTLKCREIYNYGIPKETVDDIIWSIDGDKKGCSINSSSGLLIAGSQSGLILVKAYKNGVIGEKSIVLIQSPTFTVSSNATFSGGEYILSSNGNIASGVVNYSDLYLEFNFYKTGNASLTDRTRGIYLDINKSTYVSYLHMRTHTDLYNTDGITMRFPGDGITERPEADFIGVHIKDRSIRLNLNGIWKDTEALNIDDYLFKIGTLGSVNTRVVVNKQSFRCKTPEKILFKNGTVYEERETLFATMQITSDAYFSPVSGSLDEYEYEYSGIELDRRIKEGMYITSYTPAYGWRMISNTNLGIYFKVSDMHYYTPSDTTRLLNQNFVQQRGYQNISTDLDGVAFPCEIEIFINNTRPTVVRIGLGNDSFYLYWKEYGILMNSTAFDSNISSYRSFKIPSHHEFCCLFPDKLLGQEFEMDYVFKLKNYDNQIITQKIILFFEEEN